MDKILFLDVDGVLNNSNWARKMLEEEGVRVYADDMLEDRAILLLRRIIDETGAKVIVSSSWRKIPSSFDALKRQLSYHGIEIAGETPYVGGERGDDITAWFNRNPGDYNYAILDDDSDMGKHTAHLVQTMFNRGLTGERADRCVEILNGNISMQVYGVTFARLGYVKIEAASETEAWRIANENSS